MDTRHIAGSALACALLWVSPGSAADVIAAAGFNDADGLNSDAVPGSPYALDTGLSGQGGGEAGWFAPWTADSNSTVQTTNVFEGDGALEISPTTAPWRLLNQNLTDPFRISQRVRFDAGARLVAYTEQNTDSNGTQGAIWSAFADGQFRAVDGTGDGCFVCPTEVTGFNWEPDTWYQIDMLVDPATQTYDFYVDNVMYVAPDPLGFRGTPTALNRVRYLSEGSGDVYLDALEISSLTDPVGFERYDVTLDLTSNSRLGLSLQVGEVDIDLNVDEVLSGPMDLQLGLQDGQLTQAWLLDSDVTVNDFTRQADLDILGTLDFTVRDAVLNLFQPGGAGGLPLLVAPDGTLDPSGAYIQFKDGEIDYFYTGPLADLVPPDVIDLPTNPGLVSAAGQQVDLSLTLVPTATPNVFEVRLEGDVVVTGDVIVDFEGLTYRVTADIEATGLVTIPEPASAWIALIGVICVGAGSIVRRAQANR